MVSAVLELSTGQAYLKVYTIRSQDCFEQLIVEVNYLILKKKTVSFLSFKLITRVE
jgi:hypothetical protein